MKNKQHKFSAVLHSDSTGTHIRSVGHNHRRISGLKDFWQVLQSFAKNETTHIEQKHPHFTS